MNLRQQALLWLLAAALAIPLGASAAGQPIDPAVIGEWVGDLKFTVTSNSTQKVVGESSVTTGFRVAPSFQVFSASQNAGCRFRGMLLGHGSPTPAADAPPGTSAGFSPKADARLAASHCQNKQLDQRYMGQIGVDAKTNTMVVELRAGDPTYTYDISGILKR